MTSSELTVQAALRRWNQVQSEQLPPITRLSCLTYKANYADSSEYYVDIGFNVKPVKRDGKMSVMFDPDTVTYPFLPKPTPLSIDEKTYYREEIKHLLKERNVVTVTHYCIDPETQQPAGETSDCISDPLEMARFGTKHPTSTSLVAGVRLMGGTAKVLNPGKTILIPTLQTEYSLDPGHPVEESNAFCDAHPDRIVVVCANISATVRARADWVVTSNTPVELIGHLDNLSEKIIWVFDKHLGYHVRKQTGGDILCWQGACIVHDEFRTQALARLQGEYPNVTILVHPESPQVTVGMVDVVGSTSQLIAAIKALPYQQLIAATNRGIFYKMQQAVLDKELLETLTADEGATCRNCTHCPWMVMNGLQSIVEALEQEGNSHEVRIDERLRERALVPLSRMLDFVAILRE